MPQVEGYDPTKPTSYITYLDANNLYEDAMSNHLPVGKFHFLPQPEIDTFDLTSIPPDNDTGYTINCDITYSDHVHPLHNDYPMAPEHMTVDAEMLSYSLSDVTLAMTCDLDIMIVYLHTNLILL